MAESSVFITGSSLPAWAEQATLLEIEKYLKKSLGIQTDIFNKIKKGVSPSTVGSPSGNTTGAKNVADDLDKLSRSLESVIEEYEKEKRRRKLKEKQENDGLSKGKKLENTSDKVDYTLGKVAIAGKKLFDNDSKYLSVYDSLYQSGINVLNGNNDTVDGFKALNQMVGDTGQRLEVVQQTLEKYSTSVNVVGVNKFSKAIKSSTEDLNKLGFYNENLNDLIGSMIESEKGYMNVRGKSSLELSNDAVKFGTQVDKLSKTVGMSRDKILENNKSIAKSSEVMIATAKAGSTAGGRLTAATAGLKDENLKQTILQLAVASNDMQVEGFKKLQAAGYGDVGTQLSKLAKSVIQEGLDPTEFQKRLRVIADSVENDTGKIANLADTIDGLGGAAAPVVNSIIQAGRDVSDATDKQNDDAQKTQASLSALNQQYEKTKAMLQYAFTPMIEQVNGATSALKLFNSAAYKVIDTLSVESRSWISAGTVVLGFVAGLIVARGSLNTFASLFGAKGDILAKSADTMINSLKNMSGGVSSLAGRLAKGLGSGLAGGALSLGLDYATDSLKESGHDTAAAATDIASSAAAFAGTGAAIGSLVPVLGTALGALTGGILGTGYGVYKNFDKISGKSAEPSKSKKSEISVSKTPAESKKSEISVSKTPAASTINSPSAISTSSSKSSDSGAPQAPETSLASGTGIEKPGKNSDINSILGYQASIMEQVLQSTNNLLSVNKDILKYTRAHA